MDFDKYKFRLNIKACCLYEQLTGNSFFRIGTDEDLMWLMYSCLVSNNDNMMMTFNVFQTLVKDAKVAKWLGKEYERIMQFNSQIIQKRVDDEFERADANDSSELTMTDIASALIVRHGVDAHYVMFEMSLWEIQPYLNAADIQRKSDLVTQRFWTYLTLAPNLNTKKVKSPEELVPFEWEKKDNKAQKALENNAATAFSFLSGNKTEEENG